MLSYLKKKWRQLNRKKVHKPQVFLCCYHKVGTVLLSNIFRRICSDFNWKFKRSLGKCERIPDDIDILLFAHSLIDFDTVNTPYVGVHFIRDPRDVIVSGYLYHRRCKEEWCVNTNFDLSEPILFPRVPYSQEYRSEAWKKQYLSSLGNKSYQQNLSDRSESEGLLFEMHHYSAWTIESMLQWNYNNPRISEVRFETLMSNFEESFRTIFEHFGFSNRQIARALRHVAKEDISRMTDKQLKSRPHISSRQTKKWQRYFKDIHKDAFRRRFGNALLRLGYEEFDNW